MPRRRLRLFSPGRKRIYVGRGSVGYSRPSLFGRVYRREPNWIFYLVNIPFWIFAWAVKVFVLLAIQATVLFFTGGVLLVGKVISAIARRSNSKPTIKAPRQKRAVTPMRVTPATQISNSGLPPLPNEQKYYLLLSSVQSGPTLQIKCRKS